MVQIAGKTFALKTTLCNLAEFTSGPTQSAIKYDIQSIKHSMTLYDYRKFKVH